MLRIAIVNHLWDLTVHRVFTWHAVHIAFAFESIFAIRVSHSSGTVQLLTRISKLLILMLLDAQRRVAFAIYDATTESDHAKH